MLNLHLYLAMIEDEELQHSFEQMYHQYRNLMYQRAYDILQNSETAEDVVHEAFIKIAKNMHMVQSVLPERRKALIMRILENAAIDAYRRNKKEYDVVMPLDMDEALHELSDESNDIMNIACAMLKMPLSYQQIFFLKYAHGYSNKEIAQLLGMTVSNIEKQLSRGKRKLNAYLKEVAQI